MSEATGPCCQMVQSMTRIPSSGIGIVHDLRAGSSHTAGAVRKAAQAARSTRRRKRSRPAAR